VTSRSDYGDAAEVPSDPVDCTVFAPPEAPIGNTIIVQVFGHYPEEAEGTAVEARQFDRDALRRGVTSLGTRTVRGTRLRSELFCQDLTLTKPCKNLPGRAGAIAYNSR
jgi:hypothetical protein